MPKPSAPRARDGLADAAHAENAQRGAVHVAAGEHVVGPLRSTRRGAGSVRSRRCGAPRPSSARSRSRPWFRSARRACWWPARRAPCRPRRRSCCSPPPCWPPRAVAGRRASTSASMRSLPVVNAPCLPCRRCDQLGRCCRWCRRHWRRRRSAAQTLQHLGRNGAGNEDPGRHGGKGSSEGPADRTTIPVSSRKPAAHNPPRCK